MRNFTVIFLTMIVWGCAAQPERPGSPAEMLSEQSAVVAFSVVSEEPYAIRSIFLHSADEGRYTEDIGRADFKPGNGAQLVVLPVPADRARLGFLRIKFKGYWYETINQGYEFELQRGKVTYLGRFAITRTVAGSRRYPAAVAINVQDKQLEDIGELARRFAGLDEPPVELAVLRGWSDLEFERLRRKRFGRERSINSNQ